MSSRVTDAQLERFDPSLGFSGNFEGMRRDPDGEWVRWEEVRLAVEAFNSATPPDGVAELIAEINDFAAACGAREAGNGAFKVVELTGYNEQLERNLRAVLREAANMIAMLSDRPRPRDGG